MRSFEVEAVGVRRGQEMPHAFTGRRMGGQNVSPPLHIDAVPPDAQSVSFALIDKDARDFVHWMVLDVPPGDVRLPEGASLKSMPPGSRELFNSADHEGYFGPEPPPRSGRHRYELVAYALDVPTVDLPKHASFEEFRKATEPHAVGMGENYWTAENK